MLKNKVYDGNLLIVLLKENKLKYLLCLIFLRIFWFILLSILVFLGYLIGRLSSFYGPLDSIKSILDYLEALIVLMIVSTTNIFFIVMVDEVIYRVNEKRQNKRVKDD